MEISLSLPNSESFNKRLKSLTISELKELPNNCCDTIDLGNCLEYTTDYKDLLNLCLQKLRKNGMILIIGNDLHEISRFVVLGLTQPDQNRTLLYGNGKMAIFDTFEIKQVLEMVGLEILEVDIDNLHYTIKAKRP